MGLKHGRKKDIPRQSKDSGRADVKLALGYKTERVAEVPILDNDGQLLDLAPVHVRYRPRRDSRWQADGMAKADHDHRCRVIQLAGILAVVVVILSRCL